MLRRRQGIEIFAAVFFEAGRRGDGRPERDAGVFAAGGGGDASVRQEATRRAVSARRGGWIEHCGSVWRTELLPVAAEHRDSAAETRRSGCSYRSRWVFWAASEPCASRAFVPSESAGHRACGGISRSDAVAFRRTGFYGIGNAGREGDR